MNSFGQARTLMGARVRAKKTLRCGRSQGFAFALGSRFRRSNGRLFSYRLGLFGNKEISAATVAKLHILSLQQRVDRADGQAHVTARADLIAHGRDTFLAARNQPVVVRQNRGGDARAQLSAECFGIGIGIFVELDSLKFEKV